MPRDKNNRAEHRGFGFVTFETEAAVKRIAAHGAHQIKARLVQTHVVRPRGQTDLLHEKHENNLSRVRG